MKLKILIVEDQESSQLIAKAALGSDYDVHVAANAAQFDKAIAENSYDLFLLDVLLPDSDGYQLCVRLRSNEATRNTPIVFLTGKERTEEKVIGLSLGAIDYITKPFDPAELRARIRGHLKSSTLPERGGGLRFNETAWRVYIKGQEVQLTSLEFRLLHYLSRHEDHVLSREQIIHAVWGPTTNISDRTVDTHISKLRKKMGGHGSYIHSVHGAGYRFNSNLKAS